LDSQENVDYPTVTYCAFLHKPVCTTALQITCPCNTPGYQNEDEKLAGLCTDILFRNGSKEGLKSKTYQTRQPHASWGLFEGVIASQSLLKLQRSALSPATKYPPLFLRFHQTAQPCNRILKPHETGIQLRNRATTRTSVKI
jgi:hypothetical protein